MTRIVEISCLFWLIQVLLDLLVYFLLQQQNTHVSTSKTHDSAFPFTRTLFPYLPSGLSHRHQTSLLILYFHPDYLTLQISLYYMSGGSSITYQTWEYWYYARPCLIITFRSTLSLHRIFVLGNAFSGLLTPNKDFFPQFW
jgi:hypothetical protein